MASTVHTTPFADIPGSLPKDLVPQDVELDSLPALVESFLTDFSPANLADDVLWRDFLSFTGAIRTLSGKHNVANAWAKLSKLNESSDFAASQPMSMRHVPGSSWVDVQFAFHVSPQDGLPATGSGSVSLVPGENGSWKILGHQDFFGGL